MSAVCSLPDDLPEVVQLRAETHGAAGRRWIEDLPRLVGALARRWRFSPGEVLVGGSEALVLSATRGNEPPAVLKIGLPGSADLTKETEVYTRAGPAGYATCYAVDPEANAALLERLGTPLGELPLSPEARLTVLADTMKRAQVRLAEPGGLMAVDEKAKWLAAFIPDRWERLGRPCAERTVKLALTYASDRLAAHAEVVARKEAVLVHGDVHEHNALLTLDCDPAAPYCKFVDPDGLFGERAYDLGVAVRDDSEELLALDGAEPTRALARARAELMADLTGVAFEPIWQWAFVERVSTGLHILEIGGEIEAEGRTMLAVADRLV